MLDIGLIKILLIEDEDFDVLRVKNTIKPFSNRIQICEIASNGSAALDLIKNNKEGYDVVIMDFQIAGGLMGENLIHEIKKFDPSIQIIVITKMTVNLTDYNFANSLLKAGAFWYCTKYPGDIEEYIYQPTDFILSIFNAYQKRLLERESLRSNKKLNRNIQDILASKRIIGASDEIEKLRQNIEKCASNNFSVIISGFSGTGKELVAYNIHYLSQRKYENFVPINCGSIPNELIESELFGYEKGSFTGANSNKTGLFEVANHGTVFLDEVTELPLSAQVKLLRVIQDGEIEKIGRTKNMKVDVRIIAATNRNLEEEVQEKRFREDLYYRLNVVRISVLPLRDRKDDIPILIEYFLGSFAIDMGVPAPKMDPESIDLLINYSWPGNVRELKNIIQRILFLGENNITPYHIGNVISPFPLQKNMEKKIFDFENNEILPWRQMEKVFCEKYFKFVRNNSKSDAEAAKKLGLAPPNFHRMCREMGLK
jgi:two-component system, NtrC family, response regulator AtoC